MVYLTYETIKILVVALSVLLSSGARNTSNKYEAWSYTRSVVVTSTLIIRKPECQKKLTELGIKDSVNSKVLEAIRWRYPRDGITKQQALTVYYVASIALNLSKEFPHLNRPPLLPRTDPQPNPPNGPIYVP